MKHSGASLMRQMRAAWSAQGFSALEVTMVASVIAIIALIALPVFLDRVQDARVKAALDEMSQIAKAQQLAKADTGFYFRLQDLDNSAQFNGASPSTPEVLGGIHINVPSYYWNEIFAANNTGQRLRLASTWKGPYIAYQRINVISYADADLDPNLQSLFSYNTGPVPAVRSADNPADELPLDPWGTPYIFFGTGFQIDVPPVDETTWFNAVIYSLGPDGLPGNDPNFTPNNLWREGPTGTVSSGVPAVIGTGDDLVYKVQ